MRSEGYSTQFVCLCVSESVTSLTATPLTHRYNGRYESNASALLKVFDSWISLKYFVQKLRRYLLTSTNFDCFDDTSEDFQ